MSRAEMVSKKSWGSLCASRAACTMPIWPSQPQAPYAIAVKAAGEGLPLQESRSWRCWGWRQTDPR